MNLSELLFLKKSVCRYAVKSDSFQEALEWAEFRACNADEDCMALNNLFNFEFLEET